MLQPKRLHSIEFLDYKNLLYEEPPQIIDQAGGSSSEI